MEKLRGDIDKSGLVDTKEYLSLVYQFLRTSEELDGIVLLGLDAVYVVRELEEVGDLSGYSAVLYGDAASKHRRDLGMAR